MDGLGSELIIRSQIRQNNSDPTATLTPRKKKKVASFRPLQKFLNTAVQFGLASANSLNKQLRNKLFIPFFIA